jgi:hypothetical protein
MVRTLVSGIKSLVAIVRYAGVVMRGWVRGPEWISPARPQNYGGRVQGGEEGSVLGDVRGRRSTGVLWMYV